MDQYTQEVWINNLAVSSHLEYVLPYSKKNGFKDESTNGQDWLRAYFTCKNIHNLISNSSYLQ